MKANLVGWFEIPVSDMDRARKFYETVFAVVIQVEQFGDTKMGWFPFAEDPEVRGAAGSLVWNPKCYRPSAEGTLIYFSSAEIDKELNRVETSGAEILQRKTLIREHIAYMALFKDSEGNRIALHSRN
jgi:predicted enzyme related to lactoylglutathione lyase